MELETILTGLILLSFIFIPIVLGSRGRKRREQYFRDAILNYAKQLDCNISMSEICGEYIIGLDEIRKIVFFSEKQNINYVNQHVKLTDIAICKIEKTYREPGSQNTHNKVISKLELVFVPKSKDVKETIFQFYNFNINLQLSGELQSIEKWAQQINEVLRHG